MRTDGNRGILSRLRSGRPLVHCITNYVTANDVANIILAAGASPMMAEHICEVREAAGISQSLVLNLGTMREGTLDSMLAAGEETARRQHPIILDPVGAGSLTARKAAAERLIQELPCTVIRGNVSEINALMGGGQGTGGVDADRQDLNGKETKQWTAMLTEFSRKTGAVLVVTGETDLVVWDKQVQKLSGGHPWMARITGCGCMLDGVLGAWLSVPLETGETWQSRAAGAAAAFSLCGELAAEQAKKQGTGSFRTFLIDAMSRLDDETWERRLQDAV